MTETCVGTGVLLGDPEIGSQEWRDMRLPMINGSEIAAVMGISPYESPFSLYHRKIGNLGDIEETADMYWGNALEAVVREEFNRLHDRAFRPMGQFRHVDRAWQGGAPDGIDGDEIIEVKKDRFADHWGDEGTDEIPVWYRAQVLWYLDVLGFRTCHVVVLIAGAEYREYIVEHNPAELAPMREAALEFLGTLTEGTPPQIDGHDATYDAVMELHPEIDGSRIDLSDEAAFAYLAALKAEKDAAREKQRTAALVIEEMDTAKDAYWRGDKVASRRPPRSANKHPYLCAANGAADLLEGKQAA